jgi:hypothetical protein
VGRPRQNVLCVNLLISGARNTVYAKEIVEIQYLDQCVPGSRPANCTAASSLRDYYSACAMIDRHNRYRQDYLQLEHKVKTVTM